MNSFINWLNTLSEKQQYQVKILDAYFRSRQSLPGKSELGEELVEENKSTQDIIDELSNMIPLEPAVVTTYMMKNGYELTTLQDGNVVWAIWRDFRFPG